MRRISGIVRPFGPGWRAPAVRGSLTCVNGVAGTGTAFLFTDIEGSTRLWDLFPEEMSRALARHDAIMRRSIERGGGSVFKTVGDAFCAVFPDAPGALGAALDAQIELQSETFDHIGSLRVRMA